MFIIVVGQGKVGITLSGQLSAEGHDIVTIDSNPQVLSRVQETLDVATLCGNGASAQVLEEAGAAHADLLIACTGGDEVNLLSCMAARKLGTKNTIARVRNSDYESSLRLLREELHISLSINPELTTAREIYRVLRFPASLKRETFLRDKAELVELKVLPGSKLDGLTLMDLRKLTNEKTLICAVERKGQTIIPDGSFTLMAGDRISLTAEASGLVRFMNDVNLPIPRIKKVMIVGGSRIAVHVSKMLQHNRIRVTIIDNDPDRCRELAELLPEAIIVCGNGSMQDVLLAEGIKDTDAILALTGEDEENLTISLFANYLKVPKTVTKISRTEFLDVYTNAGLDTIVSPKLLTANEIIRYVRALSSRSGQSMLALNRFMDGQVEAMEFLVPAGAAYAHVPFKDLQNKKRNNTLVAAIARNRQLIIPSGSDCLEPEDRVVIVAPRNVTISSLKDVFPGGSL